YGGFKGIPYLIRQLHALRDQIPEFVHMYHLWINEFYYHTSDLPEAVHDHFRSVLHSVESSLNQLIQNIIYFLRGILHAIVPILMIPVLVFYFLNDFSSIKKATAYVVPNKWHEYGRRLLDDIDESLGRYIRGQLLV